MSTRTAAASGRSGPAKLLVEPAVFAEHLVSRETLERVCDPPMDLVGLRNVQTGETLYVQESGLQRWLQTHR